MRKTVNKQKIAQERSYNRKYTVKNNCVPPVVNNPYEKTDKDGKPYIEWKTVKAKQPKNLTKGKCFVKKEVTVWVCRNCGHKHVGKTAPKVCPVCNHPQAYFEMEKQNY